MEHAERRAPGGGERDGDREANEQHHAGLASAELADCTDEERLSTPRVHDSAQHRGYPGQTRNIGEGVAEDHREHARQRDRGDGEDEHDPEQATELPDVVAMACMTAVSSVGVVTGGRVVASVVSVTVRVGVLRAVVTRVAHVPILLGIENRGADLSGVPRTVKRCQAAAVAYLAGSASNAGSHPAQQK